MWPRRGPRGDSRCIRSGECLGGIAKAGVSLYSSTEKLYGKIFNIAQWPADQKPKAVLLAAGQESRDTGPSRAPHGGPSAALGCDCKRHRSDYGMAQGRSCCAIK